MLTMCSAPMMILVGGLLGARIAPAPELATLPLAAIIVGTAASLIPAVLLMKRIGRKAGGYVGFGFGLAGALIGMQAARMGSFWLLIAGALCFGASIAFAQQFRFAALESLRDPEDFGKALSVMMLGGVVSAFLGPELGVRGRDLLHSPHGYAGSFLLLGGLLAIAMGLFAWFRNPAPPATETMEAGRPLGSILASPFFLVALVASASSYGVMSFVMTATPISMRELCGLDLSDTKRVIQIHIACMFLPSLAGGYLMRRWGASRMMMAGAVLYAGMMGVGLSGQATLHYGAALVLLGIGWNFLFVSGTALLPRAYRPTERFKAQAAHDFAVFAIQATASLGSGWFLYRFGWDALIWACLPALLAAFGAGWWSWSKGQ